MRIVTIILVFLSFATDSLASDSEWKLSVGLSLKQLSLDVFEVGKTDPEGILTEDYIIDLELGAESDITYFSDSNWGYRYAVNLGRFDMSTQEVALDDVDLGTSAGGYFLYAMPLVVYDFYKAKANRSLVFGFGVGIGYLNAAGNIILTESTPQITHEFDFARLTYSYGLFFEYEMHGWGFGVNLYGPEVTIGQYEYNLFDIGMVVRKKIAF